MIIGLYLATFLASIFILFTLLIKHRHTDNLIILFCLITTIQSFGRLLIAKAETLELATLGNTFVYIGGCFTPLVVTIILIKMCKLKMPKWVLHILIVYASIVFILSLTIGKSDIYYKGMKLIHGEDFNYLEKVYGPAHKLFPVLIGIYFIFNVFCLTYAIKKYRKVSLRSIKPIAFIMSIIIISYILEKLFKSNISYLSIGYFLAMLLCIHLLNHTNMFSMNTNIANCSESNVENGYIQFDEAFRCTGYNEKIVELFPEVETKWNIDEKIPEYDSFLNREIISWLYKCNKDEKKTIQVADNYYEMTVYEIPYGKKTCVGYLLELFDRTAENKYMSAMKNYNENLKKEVYKKTKDILQINDAFGKAVDPYVRDYLLSGHVKLGGETRVVSVMFCDIRSFTAMSETMAPAKVVSMLNSYFTAISKCISKHNGIINKYIGDAVMAIFGAPVPSENNALEAYEAAQDMREALVYINKKFADKGYPAIRFGIGIHSGPVLAGNIGATNRMEYTVIGDTVNTASRVESLCKEYNTDLLITESTAEQLGDIKEKLTLVDEAKIRGKEERVRLYN